MADDLPQEALVRLFHFLPIKQRCRAACVARAWRVASSVDAVSVKLKESHVPHYLHVALPDGAAQLQAAACPIMSIARSADLAWASSATTGSLLQSMPSLERLAFTSMHSVPQPIEGAESGLQSLRSLTNLQSLQLTSSDANPVLEAVPSAPRTLRCLELHLTGDNWKSSVLDKIATQLGSQASQLRSLVLRCSHASVYATTEPMESLSRLTGLTSLRMGPNPEDVTQHASPLGFPRLPHFLGALTGLRHLDISVADSPAVPALSSISFDAVRHVPDVKLSLRADTSIRAVAQLPASLSRVSGLTSLSVQAFTFEDPGGWCTTAYFDVRPLAACAKLRVLDLQLGTWECEHCEAFELPGLAELTQLQRLRLSIASRFVQLGQLGPEGTAQVQELLLALPLMRPALELHVASSMRVVLRNSKVLARAKSPGVLAHSILLEEPLPQRLAGGASRPAAAGTSAAGRQPQRVPQLGAATTLDAGADAPRGQQRDQRPAAGAAAPAAPEQAPQQQYVRAPAHVVISALRDLWPGMEVWHYPCAVPGLPGWQHAAAPELCCLAAERDAMQRALCEVLAASMGAGGAQGGEDDEPEQRGLALW